jgi:hypothetical protein
MPTLCCPTARGSNIGLGWRNIQIGEAPLAPRLADSPGLESLHVPDARAETTARYVLATWPAKRPSASWVRRVVSNLPDFSQNDWL